MSHGLRFRSWIQQLRRFAFVVSHTLGLMGESSADAAGIQFGATVARGETPGAAEAEVESPECENGRRKKGTGKQAAAEKQASTRSDEQSHRAAQEVPRDPRHPFVQSGVGKENCRNGKGHRKRGSRKERRRGEENSSGRHAQIDRQATAAKPDVSDPQDVTAKPFAQRMVRPEERVRMPQPEHPQAEPGWEIGSYRGGGRQIQRPLFARISWMSAKMFPAAPTGT